MKPHIARDLRRMAADRSPSNEQPRDPEWQGDSLADELAAFRERSIQRRAYERRARVRR